MTKGKEILRGEAGSAGEVVATVRVVDTDPEKIAKIKQGDVMVVQRLHPKDDLYFFKAAALVSNVGGVTCHELIIAREYKKPAIVGTVDGTIVLKDKEGQKVVVSGLAGYEPYINPTTHEESMRPYGAVYEYIEEKPVSLADKLEALAKARNIPLDPAFLDKMRKRG